jgi:hypothetical protein
MLGQCLYPASNAKCNNLFAACHVHSTGNLVDALRQSLDISTRDTSNTDSSVSGGVYTAFLCQLIHLLSSESSVGKHSNLTCDVAPVALASQFLEILLQQGAHADDAVCHALDFSQPLPIELRVVENLRSNTCAVNWRIRVQGADEDFELRVQTLLLFR